MPSERQHDWEHVAFLAIMLGFLTWYLWDSTSASPTFSNLILIGPVGAIALVLLFYIGAIELAGHRAESKTVDGAPVAAQTHGTPSRFREGSLREVAQLMGLFAVFVAVIPYAGFDVATFFFIIATLWLLGERRVIFTLSLAVGISAAISIAALTLLSFPMPMGIARAVWRAL